ncbi:DUF6879 family protein [Actinomadura rupiterrae]|uniref:DUF6879 family protein n=1 Tax=Actinomadura rupiterrae TaxID=559627 RepID=UPI0020A3D531|nr:DUF6879 family protein [Actinomadura rupiterrae]MCP2342961.1 hypothetical protein [Actinomadura rupiterrae]
MESISAERRSELIAATAVSLWKLELLDRYGIDVSRRSDPEQVEAVRAAAVEQTAARVAKGIELRRIKTVSEPASEYMRGAYAFTSRLVEAGEDVRWLPRRLASALFLPGNDMFVIDGAMVMFNLHDGDTNPAGQQLDDDPVLVARCREAFEAAWVLAVPHRDFQPA